MKMPIARMRIARGLVEAENALDEALLRQMELFKELVTARRATGTGPFVGQDALMRLARYQQTLVSAGGELARVHGKMRQVQVETCGIDECPPNEPTGELESEATVAAG